MTSDMNMDELVLIQERIRERVQPILEEYYMEHVFVFLKSTLTAMMLTHPQPHTLCMMASEFYAELAKGLVDTVEEKKEVT
jgi:hypothetical protein